MPKDESRVTVDTDSPNKSAIIRTLQTAVIRELQQETNNNATNDNRNTKPTD